MVIFGESLFYRGNLFFFGCRFSLYFLFLCSAFPRACNLFFNSLGSFATISSKSCFFFFRLSRTTRFPSFVFLRQSRKYRENLYFLLCPRVLTVRAVAAPGKIGAEQPGRMQSSACPEEGEKKGE